MLMDTIFKECDLRQADLTASHIWYADFSGSDMEGVRLSYANIYSQPDHEMMEKPYIPKTRFNNTNLCNADLSHGDFTMADFSGADLTGCDFTEAIVHSAIIDKKFMDQLALTSAQQEAVQWV